ncbi:MAG: hypothetical protein ACJ77A_07230 [Actinomycetota bacterium]
MISTQLGRLVLGGHEPSPDEQRASPGEDGGYGELMDVIDGVLDEVENGSGRPAS